MRPQPFRPCGILIGEGVDHNNQHVAVRWETDCAPPNRGFVTHRATAWHLDTCLGYLLVDHVQPKAYRHHNPSIWNHGQHFNGISGVPTHHPRLLTGNGQEAFQRSMLHQLGLLDHPAIGSYAAFMRRASTTPRYATLSAQVRAFHRFHKPDTAYVAYACVDSRPHQGMPHDARGTGVSTILYAAAAHATAAMGLRFFASSVQQDAAAGLWARMTASGWTSRVRATPQPRLRLHPERIPTCVFHAHLHTHHHA